MRYSYNLLYTVMSKAANTCNHDGIKIALLSREGVSTLYIGHRCKICLSNLKGLSLIYQNPRHDRNDRISSISQLYAFTAALTVVQESRHFVWRIHSRLFHIRIWPELNINWSVWKMMIAVAYSCKKSLSKFLIF